MIHNLDLHVKPVNQCKFGGDLDNEEKAALNYAFISFGFYLLQL